VNPATLMLILGLIERTVTLAPHIVALIRRLRAGEEITPQEIEEAERLVNNSVADWKNFKDKE
jgi:hypothetical protein